MRASVVVKNSQMINDYAVVIVVLGVFSGQERLVLLLLGVGPIRGMIL